MLTRSIFGRRATRRIVPLATLENARRIGAGAPKFDHYWRGGTRDGAAQSRASMNMELFDVELNREFAMSDSHYRRRDRTAQPAAMAGALRKSSGDSLRGNFRSSGEALAHLWRRRGNSQLPPKAPDGVAADAHTDLRDILRTKGARLRGSRRATTCVNIVRSVCARFG